MIVICWYIGEIEQLKVLREKSIGNCLFSVILSNLAPFVAFFTVFYLFSPPETIILLLLPTILYRCCCYTCAAYLPSRYVKEIIWDFLVYWISAIFLPVFSNKKLRFWGSGSLVESK